MDILDSLGKLWQSTGIANFIQPPDPAITSGFEQFLHQFGSPIMLVICCFLLWLGIKKTFVACTYCIRRIVVKYSGRGYCGAERIPGNNL